jgi:hypothetical protein
MLAPVRASLLLLLTAAACSDAPPSPQKPPVSTPAPFTEAPPNTPQPERPRAPRAVRGPVPDNGCAVELERPVGPGARGVALELGDTESVLIARDDPAGLGLWQLNGERWLEGPRVTLDSPVARASAACHAGACELAWVDQKTRLWRARADAHGVSAPVELARGVDRRFAPALAVQADRVLYAFTVAVDEAMHTKLVGVRAGKNEPTLDITQPGQGAAAPAFVLGASALTLVTIDAHAGISPLLEYPFDGTGRPRETLVRTPVSQPYAPPQLAAVQWASGDVEVMFTAVGKLAMTAIGRVPLRHAEAPTALSPSRGYGELSFAAARGARRALFAFEVPTSSAPRAERTIATALADGTRTDEGPSFEAPAQLPSLMRTSGGYLLAFTRAGSVHAALLRCAD